ncbi:hypothetical protein D3C75_1165540 [compost metagenome]
MNELLFIEQEFVLIFRLVLHLIQWGNCLIDLSGPYQFRHMLNEECAQKGSDSVSINITIGHDDDFIEE